VNSLASWSAPANKADPAASAQVKSKSSDTHRS
jgi:hypothetical protein